MTDKRTCRNCACVFKIERPAIMPANMDKREFDSMPREQWVCRWEPPYPVQTNKGMALMQKPTNPDSVCWQWCAEGTEPGDQRRVNFRYEANVIGGVGGGAGGTGIVK